MQPPSEGPDQPSTAVARLGCRVCGVVEQVPPHDLRGRVLAFFDAHGGDGHEAWIDLAGGAITLPRVDQPEDPASARS